MSDVSVAYYWVRMKDEPGWFPAVRYAWDNGKASYIAVDSDQALEEGAFEVGVELVPPEE